MVVGDWPGLMLRGDYNFGILSVVHSVRTLVKIDVSLVCKLSRELVLVVSLGFGVDQTKIKNSFGQLSC